MDKPGLAGRRVDWLCDELLEEVAKMFLHLHHVKAAGFKRNAAIEGLVHASALKAASIQDADVILPRQPGEPAFVASATSKGVEHAVCNPGTPDASCSCVHSQRGNLCSHIIKVVLRMIVVDQLSLLHAFTFQRVTRMPNTSVAKPFDM